MSKLSNNLRSARLAAGLSQENLARKTGISRQAYASIEGGKSVPSTEVALRLSRTLGMSVEALFHLSEEGQTSLEAELLPTPEAPRFPSRVQLLRVGERLLARPLVGRQATYHSMALADGITREPRGGGRVAIDLMAPLRETQQLVMAGGEPSITLLGRELAARGIELIWIGEGSGSALRRLAEGTAHVAGCHLLDEATGVYNVPWIRRLVPFKCAIVTFAVRQQGLMVAPGNPKGISGLDHLGRSDISMVNRERGSGSRDLLDRLIDRAGLSDRPINGYRREVPGHLAVADAIELGLADVGIGVRSVAEARGLGFIPLGEERYDLVIPDHFLHLPVVSALLDLLRLPLPRRQIEALGGYDIATMGSLVSA